MVDAHVHFLHNTTGEYTFELLESIVKYASETKMSEIFLLEHTHQFCEFKQVYAPIASYNQYQCDWISRKMGGTIDNYLKFIELARKKDYPVKINFGLEVCYIAQKENLLSSILSEYNFDFLTGSVHYIDNWGFDHKAEFWDGVNVEEAYTRYYEIMENLIETGLFNGLAHPDSIKCFGHYPTYELTDTYIKLSDLLSKNKMYVEQSGGLALNYGFQEMGMNQKMLKIFNHSGVKIMTASDAHKPEHAGKNICELQRLIEDSALNLWNLIEKDRYYFVNYSWKNNEIPVLGQIEINDEFGKIFSDKLKK